MAGNFPMNVSNNMIVNNVSTHEGGGVALDDAPNVRFVNNTVMKNITTATAVTSNGLPAPAGLSTGANSTQLQATLPAGAPPSATRSCSTTSSGTTGPAPAPVTRSPASASPATRPRSTTGTSAPPTAPACSRPTNSVLQTTTGHRTRARPTAAADPNVVSDLRHLGGLRRLADQPELRRRDPRGDGPAAEPARRLPPHQQHLAGLQRGAASKAVGLRWPVHRTGHRLSTASRARLRRPSTPAPTRSPARRRDLAITKTDGRTSVERRQAVTYTITVTNNGPNAVTGAPVTDTVPAGTAGLANVTWTCTATGGRAAARPPGRATPRHHGEPRQLRARPPSR